MQAGWWRKILRLSTILLVSSQIVRNIFFENRFRFSVSCHLSRQACNTKVELAGFKPVNSIIFLTSARLFWDPSPLLDLGMSLNCPIHFFNGMGSIRYCMRWCFVLLHSSAGAHTPGHHGKIISISKIVILHLSTWSNSESNTVSPNMLGYARLERGRDACK